MDHQVFFADAHGKTRRTDIGLTGIHETGTRSNFGSGRIHELYNQVVLGISLASGCHAGAGVEIDISEQRGLIFCSVFGVGRAKFAVRERMAQFFVIR